MSLSTLFVPPFFSPLSLSTCIKKLKSFLTSHIHHQPSSSMAPHQEEQEEQEQEEESPFLFPATESVLLPDPSRFFSPHLLSSPLPTNSFFQNLVLNNGDQPEYIHPYLIKSSPTTLSISYPSPFSTPSFIYQIFSPNLTISSLHPPSSPPTPHLVTSFSDLGLTLHLPSSNLRFFLLRGSPFITFSVDSTPLSISTLPNSILSFSPSPTLTKFTFSLDNNQTWFIYSSSPINLSHSHPSSISSTKFSGVLRMALLPASSPPSILDLCSSRYPISGHASISTPYTIQYTWETRGEGNLLMLANPLHLKLLKSEKLTILHDFKYHSMDGDLVAVIGDSWIMKPKSIPLTWHSIKGVKQSGRHEIVKSLTKDVESLTPILTTSSYFYGKAIARAARLALIAEEVCFRDVIPSLIAFLRSSIQPWLDGSFTGNGFVYESKWRGILTKQGAIDTGADFGFGLYNDHHYHLGYFIYAIAVLAKLDPSWGRRYRPQAYSILADFFTVGRTSECYTRMRCFDFWKMHSWAGGLTEFADGRNQESSSEAVNSYYAAGLLGLAYGDGELAAMASTVVSMEVDGARTWWHVREGGGMYEEEFRKGNRMVGVVWSTKRDSGLWFAPSEARECRVGIQVLPLTPVTEVLFGEDGFVKEVVEWVKPWAEREEVGEGWKGFVYALEGICGKEEEVLKKVRKLSGCDDGNSFSNLLWWIYSRGGGGGGGEFQASWFSRYCHC